MDDRWCFLSKPLYACSIIIPTPWEPHYVPPAGEVNGNSGQNNLGGVFGFSFFFLPYSTYDATALGYASKIHPNPTTSHPLPATTVVQASWPSPDLSSHPQPQIPCLPKPTTTTVLSKHTSECVPSLQTLQGLPVPKLLKGLWGRLRPATAPSPHTFIPLLCSFFCFPVSLHSCLLTGCHVSEPLHLCFLCLEHSS